MKWAKIPMQTDVLLTHGPPFKILDYVNSSKEHVGCMRLKDRVTALSRDGDLKLHVFGHVHAKQKRILNGKDGDRRSSDLGKKTTWCNVAVNRTTGHSDSHLRKPLCFMLREEGCTFSKSGGPPFIPKYVFSSRCSKKPGSV